METRALTVLDRSDPLPWQAQPGEPANWYNRFARYYLTQAGTNRTLSQAYRQWRLDKAKTDTERQEILEDCQLPGPWSLMARQYDWNDRALAYDQTIYSQWVDNVLETDAAYRARRLSYMAYTLDRLTRELSERDPRDMSSNQLNSTIKTLASQYHADLPPQPQLHAHVIALHPELQALIRDAIEKRK